MVGHQVEVMATPMTASNAARAAEGSRPSGTSGTSSASNAAEMRLHVTSVKSLSTTCSNQ